MKQEAYHIVYVPLSSFTLPPMPRPFLPCLFTLPQGKPSTRLTQGRKRNTCSTGCGIVTTSLAASVKAVSPAGIRF